MSKIVILDENTANQIAAGEVIERPSSIVKEMVENSLDAGSTAITVEIMNGGIKSIRITDNGEGMETDDVAMAFERHATSKIRKIEDLNRLSTMGFRGEALASIASVAKVEVITKTEKTDFGTKMRIEAGSIISSEPAGAPTGTTFIVRELFYNTPARYKFLKKDTTEAGYIHDVLTRIALARPDVSFKLINQGRTVLHTPGNHELLSVIYSLYGKDIARLVIPVNAKDTGITVSGFIGKPEVSRGNRGYQSILVNDRFVYNKIITTALEQAYKTKMMQKRFPFAVLQLQVNPQWVDVNVHPAKLEVRFSDEQKVFRMVYHAVSEALANASLIHTIKEKSEKKLSIPQREIPAQSTFHPQPMRKESAPVKPLETEIPDIERKTEQIAGGLPKHEKKGIGKPQIKESTDKTCYVSSGKKETEVQRGEIPDEGRSERGKVQDDRERLLHANIVGQAFSSYILLEEGGNLFFIDQHAAHERIRYEKLKTQFSLYKPIRQGLLSPLTVTLTELEMERFHELSEYFMRLGFDVEDFGNRTVIVRTVPYLLDGVFSESDFIDILERLHKETAAVSEMIPEETIYMMACKSAIKANRPMTDMEIKGLIKELVETKNPYTCVHGRPVIIQMDKRELEKRFKRIV